MEEHGYEIHLAAGGPVFRRRRRRALRAATRFFAATNSAPTSSRIALSRTFWVVSSFRSSWSIRAFIISTPVFARLPDGGAVWFPAAFDEYGQRAIRDTSPNLIDVVPKKKPHIFPATPSCSIATSFCRKARRSWWQSLGERGYHCHPLPMTRISQSRRRLQMPDHVHAAAVVAAFAGCGGTGAITRKAPRRRPRLQRSDRNDVHAASRAIESHSSVSEGEDRIIATKPTFSPGEISSRAGAR